MGQILLKPTYQPAEIVIEIDKNSVPLIDNKESAGDNMTKTISNFYPLLKFDEKVFTLAEILDFKLSVAINDIPRLSVTLHDPNFVIRKYFKNNINIGTCRIGYKHWSLKFDLLFDESKTSIFGNDVSLSGILWNKKIFETYQKSYNDLTILDILNDVLKNSGLGCYYFNNDYLQKTYNHIIQSNQSYINFLIHLINDYTDNIWSIDPNYYLHIGSFDQIDTQNVGVYTLDYKTGNKLDQEKPLIFYKNIHYSQEVEGDKKSNEENDKLLEYKIPISAYNINSNVGENYLTSKQNYFSTNEKEIFEIFKDDEDHGIGDIYANTYSKFLNHKIPFLNKIINNKLRSKTITFLTEYIIPELNILDVINLQLYRRPMAGDPDYESQINTGKPMIDTENSGNKVVIGYDFIYEKMTDLDLSKRLKMKIICI